MTWDEFKAFVDDELARIDAGGLINIKYIEVYQPDTKDFLSMPLVMVDEKTWTLEITT